MPTEKRIHPDPFRLNTRLPASMQRAISSTSGRVSRLLALLGFTSATLLHANGNPISKSQHVLPWGTCDVELIHVDANDDGYWDSLGIIIEMDATDFVSMQAQLALSNQTLPAAIHHRFRNALPDLLPLPNPPGKHKIPLTISGPQIRATGHSGPCSLEIAFDWAESLEAFGNAKQSTSSLSIPIPSLASQRFEGPFMKITDADSSISYLPDSDTIEKLTIKASLLSERKSTCEARLELRSGDRLLFDSVREIRLRVGKQHCIFAIPGPILFAQRTDGPYTAYLTVTDPYGNAATTIHETHRLAARRFLKPAAHFSGGIRSYGQDTDGDDKFDHLFLEPLVQITQPGTYRIEGRVLDASGAFVDSLETIVFMGKTGDTQSPRFSVNGLAIYRKNANGPFSVHLELYDRNNPIDGIVLQSTPFLYSDFQAPGIQLTRDCSSEAIDTNQDGDPDTLRVSAGVRVNTPGSYSVELTLADPDSPSNHQINRRQDVQLPDRGIRSIQIDFPRAELLPLGENGPWELLGISIDQDGVAMDSSQMDKGLIIPFSIADFRPVSLEILGNIHEQANDLNGDGLYDELVIEMDVFSPKTSAHACNTMLYDSHNQAVAQYVADPLLILRQGLNRIAIVFPGHQIRKSQQDGPYSLLSLSLYPIDNPDSYLEWKTESYATQGYQWDAFGEQDPE
ncbi:MAG: hypothetical protein JW706_07640 [Opitutales bacterium]|nr:hypothetical protein [Opitutales bacterium]